jgi:hypothetical protein
MNAADARGAAPAASPPSPRRAQLAALTGGLALAYVWSFRAYGLNVEDEGTLLFQILRVTRGELPYVDFSTGYTPGFFALTALLWRLTGDLVTFRTALAVVHAGTVAGLAALLAGVARPVIAIVLPLLYLAFIPLYPGEFCAFNVAYPAWFATAGWLATAGAVLAFVGRQQRPWLLVAGVAAAVTLAMKPNAGVFAFGAAAASVLATERRGAFASVLSALAWALVFTGILGGVVVVFGIVPRPLDVALYLVPLFLAMAVLPTVGRLRRPGLFADLLALVLPFLALSIPWLAFFWRRLGTDGFLREVLLIGSGAADLYYVGFPAPEPWALLLAVGAIGFVAVGWAARRWRAPWLAIVVVALAVAGAFAGVNRRGLMPEGVLWSMIWQLQSAAFSLALVAQAAGIAWLWRHRLRRAPVAPAAADIDRDLASVDTARDGASVATVLVLFAIFMHFQLYPRADFMHLVIAAPLAMVLAGFLLEQVLRVWEATGRASARTIEAAIVLVLLAGVVIGLVPGVQALTAGPRFTLPFAAAPVGVEHGRAADLRALAAAGTRLATTVGGGAATIGFPSIGVLPFLAGGHNPTPHDYFYPGRPDHREEAEILDAVVATAPPALAALNRQFTFFDHAQAYYFLLRRSVRATYGLVAREGRFDVLERGVPRAESVAAEPGRGLGAPPGVRVDAALERLRVAPDLSARLDAAAALAAYPAQATAAVLLDLATGDEALLRRVALGALLTAMTRAPEHGLERYVETAALDRRRQILLLRTVRDLRDERAASYLFAVVAAGDLRLAVDALGAMKVTRAAAIARRHLWAGSERPPSLPARSKVVAAVRSTLAAEAAPPEATAFAAHLAGALADLSLAPVVRPHLDAGLSRAIGDAETAASAADALVVLAPRGLACDLVRLLARADAAIQELVPTRVIDLAESREPVRSEARRCIRDAILAGPSRTPAIWIGAAIGDGVFTLALRDALASASADERRAAAWALGELPPDPETTMALADHGRGDPDEIVRRLATGAYAKQSGLLPRSLPRAPVPGFPDRGSAGYNTGSP